jgi:hypothetical protein
LSEPRPFASWIFCPWTFTWMMQLFEVIGANTRIALRSYPMLLTADWVRSKLNMSSQQSRKHNQIRKKLLHSISLSSYYCQRWLSQDRVTMSIDFLISGPDINLFPYLAWLSVFFQLQHDTLNPDLLIIAQKSPQAGGGCRAHIRDIHHLAGQNHVLTTQTERLHRPDHRVH